MDQLGLDEYFESLKKYDKNIKNLVIVCMGRLRICARSSFVSGNKPSPETLHQSIRQEITVRHPLIKCH